MMAISRFAESDDCPRVYPTGAVVLSAAEREKLRDIRESLQLLNSYDLELRDKVVGEMHCIDNLLAR